MMDDKDDWSADEWRALRELPLEQQVPSAARDATLGTLRAHGVLRVPQASRLARLLAAAAAVVIVFGVGFAAGDARGVERGHALALAAFVTQSHATQQEVALLVQRTGSAYVRALASLNVQHDALPDGATSQAADAAVSITEAALIELAPLLDAPGLRARLIERLLSEQAVTLETTTRWY